MFLLNNQQQKALEALDRFILSKREKVFVLEGFAGTGKTTVITTLISSRKFFSKDIVMAATTNKAVSVLQNMFGATYEHVDFKTIHKLCKIKRQISNNGDVFFNLNENPDDPAKKKNVYYYDIIIIDECSMISKKILSILLSLSSKIKGKIIFIGDSYQLPPVNETISDVFNLKVNKVSLNHIVRCSDNVVKFSESIRNSIDTNANISTKGCKGDNFKTYKNSSKWLDHYIASFNVSNNDVLLAYTNNRCKEINKYIRKKIYGELCSTTFIQNEIIVFNNFYKETPLNLVTNSESVESAILSIEPIMSNPYSDQNTNVFYTSQKGIIIESKQIKLQMPKFPFESLFNLKKKLDVNFTNKSSKPKRELDCPICFEKIRDVDVAQLNCSHVFCRKCIKMWLEQNDLCPYCRIKVENNKITFDDDEILSKMINDFKELTDNQVIDVWQINVASGKQQGCIYVPILEFQRQFEKIQSKLKNLIQSIKRHLEAKKTVKERKFFVIRRLWEYYYYSYVDLFADISYGYCITVHKSQGSTFDDVYVDCNNIMKFKNNDTLNCLYTAVTRSSKTLYMLV